MPRVVLTGAPGAGKTTLLDALAARGFATVTESAREIIRARKAQGLPPRPPPAELAAAVLEADTRRYASAAAAAHDGTAVFFDRSAVESLAMQHEAAALSPAALDEAIRRHPFHPEVMLLPAWPAIYTDDSERDEGFEHAQRVGLALEALYRRFGYTVTPVPPAPVDERCDFVLQRLARGGAPDPGIRRALAADAPGVARVLIESRRVFMPYAASAHAPEDVQRWVAQQLVPGGGVYVIEAADGGIVAVLATVQEARVAWIEQLYVLPGHEQRGCGSRLLRHALRSLRRPVRLFTFQANAAARRFYESRGWAARAFSDGAGNEERCPDVLYEYDAHD